MKAKAIMPAAATFLIAAFLLGFFMTVQVKVFGDENQYENLSYQELTAIYSQLNLEVYELKSNYLDLKDRYEQYSAISVSTEKFIEEAKKEIHALKVYSGETAVEGRGITVQIRDNDNNLLTGDLLDLINELRAAGALAIAVNNVRILSHTGIVKMDDGFLIDGQFIRSPYNVEALGDVDTLFSAVIIPGGIIDSLKGIPGLVVSVEKNEKTIFPQGKKLEFRYGRLVKP